MTRVIIYEHRGFIRLATDCPKLHIGSRLCNVGQWLWLSWQSGRFQLQRSVVQIQSSANFYIGHLFVYCKIKKKLPGMAHLKKDHVMYLTRTLECLSPNLTDREEILCDSMSTPNHIFLQLCAHLKQERETSKTV